MNTLRDNSTKTKEVNPPAKFKFNKRVYVFGACLLISIFSWFLIKIQKDYEQQITLAIAYTGFPSEKLPGNKLPEKVSVDVRASGFTLMSIGDDPITLDCSMLKRFGNEVFILTSSKIKSGIASQLGSDVEIISVNPDTIFFNFGLRISRKVPVKLNVKYTLEENYCVTDSMKVQPEFVTISGAENVLEKIKFVPTEELILKDLESSFKEKIRLKTPGKGQADLSVDSVLVFIPVEKLVESEIEVPVTVKNFPDKLSIKLDVEKVTVTFLSPESKIKSLKASSFSVIMDYRNLNKKGEGTGEAVLVKHPSFVKNCILSETDIDYFISKKR